MSKNHDIQYALLENLKAAQLVRSEAVPQNQAAHTPWFISILLAMSGWLAGVFFILFFVMLFALHSQVSNIGLGAVLLAGAYALFVMGKHLFLHNLAFALSLAGQGFVAYGLVGFGTDLVPAVWLILALELMLAWFVPKFLHRLFSAIVAFGCVGFLLHEYHLTELCSGVFALVASTFWLKRSSALALLAGRGKSLAQVDDVLSAFGFAASIALLLVSALPLATWYGDSYSYQPILEQLLLTLVAVFAVASILRRYHISLISQLGMFVLLATCVLGVVSVFASGLLAGGLVLVLGMANGRHTVIGSAVIALVGYVFWYYYQLETTLLIKSASLAVVGLALLGLRFFTVVFFQPALPNDMKAL